MSFYSRSTSVSTLRPSCNVKPQTQSFLTRGLSTLSYFLFVEPPHSQSRSVWTGSFKRTACMPLNELLPANQCKSDTPKQQKQHFLLFLSLTDCAQWRMTGIAWAEKKKPEKKLSMWEWCEHADTVMSPLSQTDLQLNKQLQATGEFPGGICFDTRRRRETCRNLAASRQKSTHIYALTYRLTHFQKRCVRALINLQLQGDSLI